MFGIGTVARLADVSVRTLRYYDQVGLLRPVWVDPDTGYRWYAASQLHRLHRILALRDLGVRLTDIAQLIDEEMSAERLRGILQLRRAETRDRMAREATRLARVEARLRQIEEDLVGTYDVVVKQVEAVWMATASENVAHYGEVGPAEVRLWPRIEAVLEAHGVAQTPGPSIATTDFVAEGEPIRVTAAIAVPDDAKVADDGVETIELPGIPRAASTVIHGDPDYHEAFNALGQWARDAGEKGIGHSREVYLDCDGPRDTWVVELQIALEAR